MLDVYARPIPIAHIGLPHRGICVLAITLCISAHLSGGHLDSGSIPITVTTLPCRGIENSITPIV